MPLTKRGEGEEIISFQEEFPLRWGTYEVQRTMDTDNLFPLISHGLPEKWQDMRVGKEEL